MTKNQQLLPTYYAAARLITEYVTLEDEKRKVTYLNPFSGGNVSSIADHLSTCVLIGRALGNLAKTAGKTVNTPLLDSLLLWHDAPETRYGDIGRDARKYVLINENKARVDEFGTLPFGEEIITIIEKFESGGENQEVKFAKDADALYVVITIKEFLQKGIRINNPDQRIEKTLKRLSTDEGFALGKTLAQATPEDVWQTLLDIARYPNSKNSPFPTSVSTTMCIGWMLCELAKMEGEKLIQRDKVLNEIFLQRMGNNEFAHDARVLYDQLQEKRSTWEQDSEKQTSEMASKMLLTSVGKNLAEILAEIDLFDWWQLSQGYAEITETGNVRLLNR